MASKNQKKKNAFGLVDTGIDHAIWLQDFKGRSCLSWERNKMFALLRSRWPSEPGKRGRDRQAQAQAFVNSRIFKGDKNE